MEITQFLLFFFMYYCVHGIWMEIYLIDREDRIIIETKNNEAKNEIHSI